MSRILVPHDLTPPSSAALEAARRFGSSPGGLHVVHVLPRLAPAWARPVWPRDDDARVAHAREELGQQLHDAGFGDAIVHLELGDPASRIVALASELGADMIVMPSRSRSRLRRLLLGSVAEHVARFAPCPVLLLPASALPTAPAPEAAPPAPAPTPEEQLEAVTGAICDAVRSAGPSFLTAARIGVPQDRPHSWWEERLSRRLAASGLEFVDLTFTPWPHPAEILTLRFEDRFC